jgi:hypothetical protein
MRPSGSVRRALASAAMLVGLSGCWLGLGYGFAGGGLDPEIRTVAVLPFDNQTPSPELQAEFAEAMRGQLERRLGLRSASQARAHALVRGVILRYDPDVPVAYSADPNQATSARRRLAITVDVEIVNQRTGEVLFERKGLRGEGEYPERGEAEGRRLAIERIVNDVVEGAQSQW